MQATKTIARVMTVALRVRARIATQISRPDLVQIRTARKERDRRHSKATLRISRLRTGRRCAEDGIRKWVVILAWALSAAAAIVPTALAGTKAETLVLTGSSTIAPLAAEIGKRFESLHPGVRINVQTGGSSRGILDARQGTADIGMVSRSLKEGEKDLLAFSIARDGVGLIVHAANPVSSLSSAQVGAIYSGRTGNWKEVGGHDAPITVVNKAEGRSTLELFLHYFKLDNRSIKAHIIIGDNEQGVKTVAGNANAIGYVSIGAAEYNVSHGIPIKLLPVGGVAASSENVANGSFPIARPLNLVTRSEPEGLARMFIDFARSASVHDIVRQQYFVPLYE